MCLCKYPSSPFQQICSSPCLCRANKNFIYCGTSLTWHLRRRTSSTSASYHVLLLWMVKGLSDCMQRHFGLRSLISPLGNWNEERGVLRAVASCTCTPLAFFLWYTPTATEVHKISRCLPLTDSPLFLPELPGRQTLWSMTTTPLRDLPRPRPPHSLSPSHVHSLCTLAVVRGASANIILQGAGYGAHAFVLSDDWRSHREISCQIVVYYLPCFV